MKKERWTELEVLDLPSGELEYFERKSGALFSNEGHLRNTLGKALSAFANSGGGNIVLGVDDDGRIDGVPTLYRGRQPTREWLERVIPHLVTLPLQDFNVHEVLPNIPSQIPRDLVVIVIDVGDSMLAPHQDINTKHYFHRVGSCSEPAPHHVLEMLRGRERYPTQKVAHAWLNFVISPLLTRLELERSRLNNQKLHYDVINHSFDGIDRFYVSDGALSANQMQFLESYPDITQQIEVHDAAFRDFSYAVSSLSRALKASDVFKAKYLSAISPESLDRIRRSHGPRVGHGSDSQVLSGLFGNMSEAQRLALLAQHVINDEGDLLDDKMVAPLWNLFRRDFMAVLEEPATQEESETLMQTVARLMSSVDTLISLMKNIRRDLAQKYGEVWEDETLRFAAS